MKEIKLKENERIMIEVRRYGLTTWWSWLLGFGFLFAAAFFMFWLFRHDWWGQSLFAILIFLAFFTFFKTYYFWKQNVFIITTHRLIDVEKKSFFERIVSEIPYDQVEDVFGKVSGIGGTMFRYGSVEIQTGNGKVKIIINKIKSPLRLQQQINEMRDRYISKYAHDFSGDVAGAIIDKLYELELPDLRRVQKTLEKRIDKLNK